MGRDVTKGWQSGDLLTTFHLILLVYSFIMHCSQVSFDSFMSGFGFIIGLKVNSP